MAKARKTSNKTRKDKIYTAPFVLKEVQKMLKEVLEDKTMCFIQDLFETKPYTRQRFSEWAQEYANNDKISDTIKKIEETLEGRIVKGGLCGRMQPTMAIFTLKNKYKWSDKSELELAGKKEEPFILEIRGYNPEKEKEDTK